MCEFSNAFVSVLGTFSGKHVTSVSPLHSAKALVDIFETDLPMVTEDKLEQRENAAFLISWILSGITTAFKLEHPPKEEPGISTRFSEIFNSFNPSHTWEYIKY